MRPYLINQRRGGWARRALRIGVWVSAWALLVGLAWAALSFYADAWRATPPAPDILAHDPATHVGLEVEASGGVWLAGALRERLAWTPIDAIPVRVIGAFVAAEDARFFEHRGVDPRSVARAALANWRAGAVRQGGSTITQQLAKMYVGDARTLERKLDEALLARRIEQRYSKREILEAYLNRIYLGGGARGVGAAARRHFGRPLSALTLGEAALLAALAQAPSRLDPRRAPAAALARRDLVLERMEAGGMISAAERVAAQAEALRLAAPQPRRSRRAPYLVDEARRRLDAALPLAAGGPLRVTLSADLALQREALVQLSRGAQAIARRRGDRLAVGRAQQGAARALMREATAAHGALLRPGREYLGVVTATRGDGVELRLGQARAWAARDDAGAAGEGQARGDASAGWGALRPGDLVRARVLAPLPFFGVGGRAQLISSGGVEGGLAAIELGDGALRALAGGTDHARSQFNRMTQGCRQPGSVFKALLYARALTQGMTTASMLHDAPLRLEDAQGRLLWSPRNADGAYAGPLTLSQSLASSRNLPAVMLLERVGAEGVAALARRAGLVSHPLEAGPALALGASCVRPLEMTTALGVLARRGQALDVHLLEVVSDAAGRVLLDQGASWSPGAPLDARLWRLAGELGASPAQALEGEVAYLMTFLLREVVRRGTASAARQAPFAAAGKTGTTDAFDVWFIGFSESLVTGVWLGEDLNHRPLGRGVTGGHHALPVWQGFMEAALIGRPQVDPLEAPPPGIVHHRVDPTTGALAHPDGPGTLLPFIRGTAPRAVAPDPTGRAAQRADILDRDF